MLNNQRVIHRWLDPSPWLSPPAMSTISKPCTLWGSWWKPPSSTPHPVPSSLAKYGWFPENKDWLKIRELISLVCGKHVLWVQYPILSNTFQYYKLNLETMRPEKWDGLQRWHIMRSSQHPFSPPSSHRPLPDFGSPRSDQDLHEWTWRQCHRKHSGSLGLSECNKLKFWGISICSIWIPKI